MSILTAISRGCKNTLVDGSVRYTIEFGPLEAVAAATLFGMPGTEMGVVALKDGRAPNGGLGDEKDVPAPNDAGLTARADHTEDVLDMVPRALNIVFGDETTAVRTNGAGLHDEPATSDQVAGASKTIKTVQSDLVKWSGVLSNDKQFWEWAAGRIYPLQIFDEKDAAAYIRATCNIASRAELATNKAAAEKFRQIMRDFNEWGQK